MPYLLLENSYERKELLHKLCSLYMSEEFSTEQAHIILELLIYDTIDHTELFDEEFLTVISTFKDDYLDRYNSEFKTQLDVDASNYIFNDDFKIGTSKLLESLRNLH